LPPVPQCFLRVLQLISMPLWAATPLPKKTVAGRAAMAAPPPRECTAPACVAAIRIDSALSQASADLSTGKLLTRQTAYAGGFYLL
jgi:hypothetical protein